ncbi:unnamed protein product [Cuscuta epithymum]|uniref:Uncharacterized protein n=1 Tax=Cuscuta epithymum TaxID=186058 RepID=A0AAV0E9W3_9ASTE|nr:unnamed protein product [Cuscuta epithymum]
MIRLLFFEASHDEAKVVHEVLNVYEKASGQAISELKKGGDASTCDLLADDIREIGTGLTYISFSHVRHLGLILFICWLGRPMLCLIVEFGRIPLLVVFFMYWTMTF